MRPEDVPEAWVEALAHAWPGPMLVHKHVRAALAAVAPLIAAAEREACAGVANTLGIERWHGTALEDACDEVAAAIRARKIIANEREMR